MKKQILSLLLTAALPAAAQTTDFQQWTPTPPMGWNSFDCYGASVTEDEVRAQAEAMCGTLRQRGYEYVVVDIRWHDAFHAEQNGYNVRPATYDIDSYGRLLPDTLRFPSAAGGKGFGPLAQWLHDKGLKFGIHLMRGIATRAVEENTPVEGTNVRARDISSERDRCTWLGDMLTVDASKPGAQEYYNSLFRLYAAWGVDFVKIDDMSFPYHKDETELIRRAIDQCGRPIVLSLSPGPAPVDEADHLSRHANMWRIIGDLWDEWPRVRNLLDQSAAWAHRIGKGGYPDGDMLPLGRMAIRSEVGRDRTTRLTPGEQRIVMALMAMLRSPLMMGGDLTCLDSLTLALLTNEQLLRIDQLSSGNRVVSRKDDITVWAAEDSETGDTYVCIINAQDQNPLEAERALWRSDVLSATTGRMAQQVDIPLSSRHLFLYASDAGDGEAYDHANWLRPAVQTPQGTVPLTSLEWQSATTGFGEVTKGRSCAGTPLQTGDSVCDDGIGTHANSLLTYELPEGSSRFTATVALDASSQVHPEMASVQFFVFDSDPAGPMPPSATDVTIDFASLGIASGKHTVRDVWTGRTVDTQKDHCTLSVPRHDAVVVKVEK